MNKVSIIIESILAVAVVVLFVLVFMFKPASKTPAVAAVADGSGMCMAGWTERAVRWYESLT